MIVLLVLCAVAVVVALGFLAQMARRDEPFLGMVGMFVMLGAGVLAAAYGALG